MCLGFRVFNGLDHGKARKRHTEGGKAQAGRFHSANETTRLAIFFEDANLKIVVEAKGG